MGLGYGTNASVHTELCESPTRMREARSENRPIRLDVGGREDEMSGGPISRDGGQPAWGSRRRLSRRHLRHRHRCTSPTRLPADALLLALPRTNTFTAPPCRGNRSPRLRGRPRPPPVVLSGNGSASERWPSISLQLMDALEFRRFTVVGPGRGARVAYRMALDHPE